MSGCCCRAPIKARRTGARALCAWASTGQTCLNQPPPAAEAASTCKWSRPKAAAAATCCSLSQSSPAAPLLRHSERRKTQRSRLA
jgi:hypothetical protein